MTSFIFKWIGFWKKIWISFGKISNSKLYATQWYSWGKIRWLLQLCEIGVGSYNESSWKSFESALKPSFKFWVLNLNFKLWHVGNISKTKPDKYLIKSMRGANMTLQKYQRKQCQKIWIQIWNLFEFEKKIDFYEVWILPLEKCSNEREYSPDHLGIYIPYIKYL